MTLAILMRYCKVAYLAIENQFKRRHAKECPALKMYRRFEHVGAEKGRIVRCNKPRGRRATVLERAGSR